MMKKNLSLLATGLCAVLLQGCYVSSNLDNEQSNYTASKEILARGAVVYENYCLGCHGPDLKGDGPLVEDLDKAPKDLTEKALHITPVEIKVVMDYPHFSHETIRDRIKYGNETMPPLKDILSKDEIDDLTLYVSDRIRNAE